ncbi:MAG: TIGR03564 family F420-dependent LLM class oxidoreductase [Acidimicrobiales bacterium]
MRGRFTVGLFAGSDATSVAQAVERVRSAADGGFEMVWLPQTNGLDAFTVLAVAGREVPGIGLGTAVVPIQGRHPIPLALQTLTTADAIGAGRLTAGLGVTHPAVSEGWFGVPYRGIVDVCAEVIEAVDGLLSDERRCDVEGDHVTARLTTPIEAAAPSVVLAALGPRMLELAGRATDGTVTWMTGPVALERDIVPTLRRAADDASRPAPRVIVGIPVCVSDDGSAARDRLAPMMDRVATMPSYARKVAAEGVTDPVDLVVLGDEVEVTAQLSRYVDAGMTELCANVVGTPEEQARTREFLAWLT